MASELVNKTFLITGATSGIGLATAELLGRQGAALIGVGRSAERCRQAEAQLRRANPDARIGCLTADLRLQSEVTRLAGAAADLLAAWGCNRLDGLLNNAGTFTYWMALTADGIETQWAVNHLAGFLLTHHLLPLLAAAPSARVVTVSSDSHYAARLNWNDLQLRRRYNGLATYGNTKLANILFSLELNRRLGNGTRVRAFAADPGLVKTDIGLKGTPGVARWVWKLRRSGGVAPETAARGIAYLLADPAVDGAQDIYWKDGRPKRPSPRALDADSARRLWEVSTRMCSLPQEAQDAPR